MTIIVDPDDNSYDMGLLRIEDQELVSNEFEYSIGGANNTGGGTNSNDPIRYKGNKNEYSWSASDIPPEFKTLLIKYKIEKKSFPITIFHHGPDGNYIHEGTLTHARIDEVTSSYSDEGPNLDISGTALGFDLP